MKENGKTDKIPDGKVNDPSTWTDYTNILHQENVGIILNTNHGLQTTLACADFDYSVNSKYEAAIVALGKYGWIEISQSGQGYHVFFEVLTSDVVGQKFRTRYDSETLGSDDGRFELYFDGRFIALTFNSLPQSGLNRVLRLQDLGNLLNVEIAPPGPKKSTTGGTGVRKEYSSVGFKNPYDFNLEDGQIDISYKPSSDLSSDVFQWFCKVIGYCKDSEQLFRLFHKTDLANRESGKYSDSSSERKFARTLHLMFDKIDLQQKFDEAKEKVEPFESVSDETIEKIVEQEVEAQLEYRLRYVKLLEQTFACGGQIRRNIFDGYAYFRNKGKLEDIESDDVVKTLRDEIRVLNRFETDKTKRLKGAEVADAMTAYRFSLKEELLLDIEEWDGEDRLKHLSTLINFADKEITHEVFEYFLKDWSVRCVNKVMTGRGTNRMIVLQGGQGIGKDVFLSMVCGGWTPQFTVEVSAPGKYDGEDVLMEQVHDKATAILPELDKFDPLDLKRLITAPTLNFRPKYGKKSISHINRTSYLGSCNPKNPFTDTTGNRRFLFFRITGRADTAAAKNNYPHMPVAIKWEFNEEDGNYKAQVLAQGFHMWRENGKSPLPVNSAFESIMTTLVDAATPDDPSIDVIDQFDVFIEAAIRERSKFGDDRKLFVLDDLNKNNRLDNFVKSVEMKIATLKKELEKAGRSKRYGSDGPLKNMYFFFPENCWTAEEREKYLESLRPQFGGVEPEKHEEEIPF